MTGTYTYAYPRPMLSVDAVVFCAVEREAHVLLIQRKHDPHAGAWALPGGFVEDMEPLDEAVARELVEETGLAGVALKQFRTYGDPGRDPRGHAVSVVYTGQWTGEASAVEAGDDAALAQWFPLSGLPELAFDHGDILRDIMAVKEQGAPHVR